MGVTELFHFRRLLRRGRRVADGSRQFVIGLDKTATDANTSTGALPKGSHFTVAYNRSGLLTEEEMDVCNNNNESVNNGEQNHLHRTNCNNGGRIARVVSFTTSPSRSGESVVFSIMPGASPSTASDQTGISDRSRVPSTSTAAVITTTELKEYKL